MTYHFLIPKAESIPDFAPLLAIEMMLVEAFVMCDNAELLILSANRTGYIAAWTAADAHFGQTEIADTATPRLRGSRRLIPTLG
jgi:hypothetical protein